MHKSEELCVVLPFVMNVYVVWQLSVLIRRGLTIDAIGNAGLWQSLADYKGKLFTTLTTKIVS